MGMLFRTPLSVYVDDIKLAGKKQNIDPMWKLLNQEVDLGEPTSFLDLVYLGCTQRQCEISKVIVDNYRTMLDPRISAGGTEKHPYSKNLRISSRYNDKDGHAKKCVERYCELANKTTQQLYKVSTPCIDDHHFRPMKASDHCYHEQFMESFSSASYSKWDDDRAWSSQESKTEIKTYDQSGRPDKTSWRMVRKVRPGHEEILLDGTAQSVRNEETLRGRLGRPDDINSREEARPQQFVIGNDEAELELSVESRSFVNRVNDQVRKRQKRISNVRENAEKSMIW